MLNPCLQTAHIPGGGPRTQAGQTVDPSGKGKHQRSQQSMKRAETRAAEPQSGA